jgi:hypothetical protein
MKNSVIVIMFLFSSCTIIKSVRILKAFNSVEVVSNANVNRYSLKNDYTYLIVPTQVNSDTMSFLLDTGWGLTCINANSNFLKNIKRQTLNFGIPSTNDLELNKLAYSSLVKMNLNKNIFILNRLLWMSLGELQSQCFKIDGIMGANLLQNTNLMINADSSYFEINSNYSSFINGFKELNFRNTSLNRTPIIDCQINNLKLKSAKWDTGNYGDNILLYNPKKDVHKIETFIKNFPKSSVEIFESVNSFGANAQGKIIKGHDFYYRILIDSINLSGNIIDSKNYLIVLPNKEVSGVKLILGMNFIKTFNSVIDFKAHKIYLQNSKTRSTLIKKSSIYFNPSNYIIERIDTFSRFYLQGLRISDTISKINNKPIKDNNLSIVNCDKYSISDQLINNNSLISVLPCLKKN